MQLGGIVTRAEVSRGMKLRFLTPVLLGCVVASRPAWADDHQIKQGPLPQWVKPSEPKPVADGVDGAAFVRRQDVLVHLDSQGQEQYFGYRIKILQPAALQLGNISISWNPAAGPPVVDTLKVYRGSEVIDVLKTTSFDILRREDELDAAKIDGVLTAALRVADLRVGDELEVGYTLRITDPTLANDDAGMLALSPNPAAGRYRVGLSWEPGQKPELKVTPDLASIAQTGEHAVSFQLDDPGASSPPKDAPPRFQWQRTVEYSRFSDWPAVSRRLAPLYARAATLSPTSPLVQEAKRIAAGAPTMLGRASAALKLVQQDVRYVYVGLDRGNLTPVSADETWQRRYGDCKGKTVLLMALLAQMGIKSEAVVVNTSGSDDGLNEHLPSPRVFDHVLVRARLDGKAYWLDGTMPAVVAPSPEPTFPLRWVLPLSTQGAGLENIPWQPAKRPEEITLIEIDARAGFDQPAHVNSSTITRGLKGLKQQIELSTVTQDQLLTSLRQELTGGTWQTVENVTWRYDQKAQASIMSISGTWKLDWEDDGGGAKSMPLPGGGFSRPERRGRAAGQNQSLPYYNKPEFTCHVTTVRLPVDTRSKQWASKSGFDTTLFGRNYYRAFDLRGGAIRMVRGFRVVRDEIDADTANKDNERITALDNSMGYIFFAPPGQAEPLISGTPVPATYEIDWTAADVPCVAANQGNVSAATAR